MNSTRLFWICMGLARSAAAFLPPDAARREPEIRAYRQAVRNSYEKRLEAHQAHVTREYERASSAIGVPPWELVAQGDSVPVRRPRAAVDAPAVAEKKGDRSFLVSIVLLALIASAALGVRRATSTRDE